MHRGGRGLGDAAETQRLRCPHPARPRPAPDPRSPPAAATGVIASNGVNGSQRTPENPKGSGIQVRACRLARSPGPGGGLAQRHAAARSPEHIQAASATHQRQLLPQNPRATLACPTQRTACWPRPS